MRNHRFREVIARSLTLLAMGAASGLLECTPLRAEGGAPFGAGLGIFALNLFKPVSVSSEATTGWGGTMLPSLVLMNAYPVSVLGPQAEFQLQLGFSPLGAKDSDGKVTRRVLWISPLAAYRWGDVTVRGGVSALMTLYSSSRASITLNNGNSTDVYYAPSSGETTRVLAVQLGVSTPLAQFLELHGDLLVSGVLSSTRRSAAFVTSLVVPLWL